MGRAARACVAFALGSMVFAPGVQARSLELPLVPLDAADSDVVEGVQELRARVVIPAGPRIIESDGLVALVPKRTPRGCRSGVYVTPYIARRAPRVLPRRRLDFFGEAVPFRHGGVATTRILDPASRPLALVRLRAFAGRIPDDGGEIDLADFALGVVRVPAGVAPEQPRRRAVVLTYSFLEGRRACRREARRRARKVMGVVAGRFVLRVTGPDERDLPADPPPVRDLSAERAVRFGGSTGDEQAGSSVAGVGDVNGDGLADVAVGGPHGGERNNGVAYVVFGTVHPRTNGLGRLGSVGLRLDGEVGAGAGSDVDGVGDMNGDGLDDLIVGASDARGPDGPAQGAAFVVLGRRAGGRLALTGPDLGGFRILGARRCSGAGYSVAGLGDVNGDGRPDVGVTENRSCGDNGAAFVVYGSESTAPVDLGELGDRGFRIDGPFGNDGLSVARAGDVNGDDLADVLLGVERGGAYLVLGAPQTPQSIDLRGDPRAVRFRAPRCLEAGDEVAAAGDVNGDGLDDVLIAAPSFCLTDPLRRTSAFLVFGGPLPSFVHLGALGARGLRIEYANAGEFDDEGPDLTLAGGVDFNGDGLDDVVIGVPQYDVSEAGTGSEAFVVFGRPEGGVLRLSSLGEGGFRLVDGDADEGLAEAIDVAGDFDGNGTVDLALGAPDGHFNGRPYAGLVRITAPTAPLPDGACVVALAGGDGPDGLLGTEAGDLLDGRGGDDRLGGIGGDDCLLGGTGTDRLVGGEGNDRLEGGAGGDALFGDAGEDVLTGGPGDDELDGEGGRDTVSAGPGDDLVHAGFPIGLEEELAVPPPIGPDTVAAGPGDDRVDAVDGRRDRVDCGPGRDRVQADPGDRLRRCERIRHF